MPKNKKAQAGIAVIIILALIGGGIYLYYVNSGGSDSPEECTPDWITGAWSSCSNNIQIRTVIDNNECGIDINKPNTQQDCTEDCSPNWQCSDWSECINNLQTRTCTDLNDCGILIGRPALSQYCEIQVTTLQSYLSLNPSVKSYIDSQSQEVKDSFYSNYNKLEAGQQMQATNFPDTHGAKIALSVWIDKNNLVPWKLRDYTSEDLSEVLNYADGYIYECDPQYTYNYFKSYVKSTKTQTIASVIDFFRKYRHHYNGDASSGTGCIKEVIPQDNINGCHAASQFMAGVLTTFNIPAYYRYNPVNENWYVAGHGELVIPGIGYMSHGDNIYGNTIMQKIPSSELIIPWSVLQNQIIPAQVSSNYTFGFGRNPIEQRYMFEVLQRNPPSLPNSPYSYCLEAAGQMGSGVATQAEITAMANSWNCM